MGGSYTVVADPMERDLPEGPVVCTGDLLHLAPPPPTDPTGSLLAEVMPDIHEAYASGDAETILSRVRAARNDLTLRDVAEERYRVLFDRADGLYYVAGNQDVPAALSTAAADSDHVAHADTLDGVTGVDGVIPEAAGTPPDTFPCECSLGSFDRQVGTGETEVVVAHTLPPDFDPAVYGVSLAISSTNDDPTVTRTGRVLRLPSYRMSGVTARLSLPGDGREPTVEVRDPASQSRGLTERDNDD